MEGWRVVLARCWCVSAARLEEQRSTATGSRAGDEARACSSRSCRPRLVEIGGAEWGLWIMRGDGVRERGGLLLQMLVALGGVKAARICSSGKWNFDEAIGKYIDLSYHDKKGGDSSTAVRRWRMFCAEAAADGSWVRALEASATRDEKLGEEYLVMRFACWLVVEWGVQPSTAEGYISTVQAWHARRFGCRLAGGMPMARLKALYKGMTAAQGGVRPKKKRLGLKPRQLARLMAQLLGEGSALEANWRACCSVGFCGLLRGAELGVASGEAWAASTGVSRADVAFRRREGREEAVIMMRPRKQGARKTQQGKQVPVLLTSGGKFLDPVKALKELFERDPVPKDVRASTPLFRGADGAAFSTARIRGLVKWMVAADGGDPALYGAHSLRIGGATAALAAGVSALVIKAMGRWGSDVFEIYAHLSDRAARSFGRDVSSVDYEEVQGAYYSEDL